MKWAHWTYETYSSSFSCLVDLIENWRMNLIYADKTKSQTLSQKTDPSRQAKRRQRPKKKELKNKKFCVSVSWELEKNYTISYIHMHVCMAKGRMRYTSCATAWCPHCIRLTQVEQFRHCYFLIVVRRSHFIISNMIEMFLISGGGFWNSTEIWRIEISLSLNASEVSDYLY